MDEVKVTAEDIIEFLQKEFDGRKIQMFDSRNVVGDRMCNIYRKGNVSIDYCPGWDYIEIFGLTGKEFNTVMEAIGY